MKLLIYSLLLLSLRGSYAQDVEQQFYYLRLSSNNCEIHCFLNGFPIYEIENSGQLTNQIPVNLALVGENNVLKIVAVPLGDNAFVKGGIASYKGSEVVSTDDEKSGVLDFRHDITKEVDLNYVFDNDRFDFSKVLQESPVIRDSSALIDYAMKLKTWVNKKDYKALLVQMEVKIEDYATAYSVPSDIIKESMKQSLTSDVFEKKWIEISKSQIRPVSYCEGRVWELSTVTGKPLFYAETEDGNTSLPVFVAKINGKFRVVR